jgi:hypothetical protein
MDTNCIQDMDTTAAAHRSAHPMAIVREKEVEIIFCSELEAACCGEVLRPFWADDGRLLSVCARCGQKYTDKTQVRYGVTPWIGVDLDGTLAHDPGTNRKGQSLDQIGSPIKPMLNRLKKWIAEGKTVKIFTARASSPKQVAMIKKWLLNQGLPGLEVTNVKDLAMIELWDDRCVQVKTNSGEPIQKKALFNFERQAPAQCLSRRSQSSGILSRLRIFLAF